MIKRILFSLTILTAGTSAAQMLFQESFSAHALQTYTSAQGSAVFGTVSPAQLINDGRHNFASFNNTPFHVPALKTTGWALLYHPAEKDTFLVSTSWLDTAQTVNRWYLTAPVSLSGANVVLSWHSRSPDPAFPESYEVYVTNKTGTLTANDFDPGDKVLTVTAENSAWTVLSVNLSAFSGQTVRIAFRNVSSNKFQIWIDDIAVQQLPHAKDAMVQRGIAAKYFLPNTGQQLGVIFRNTGAVSITSAELNYQVSNGSIITQTFAFPALTPFQSVRLNFPQPFTVSSPGVYPSKIWISASNGTPENSTAGDTLLFDLVCVSNPPERRILAEQVLSAMHANSPDGQAKLQAAESSSLIVVNIHDQDSLTIPASAGIRSLSKGGAVSASFSRRWDDSLNSHFVNRAFYSNRMQAQWFGPSPATVSVTATSYDPISRLLSFTLEATFLAESRGKYLFGAHLIERHVHGPSTDTLVNGYNQLSAYFNVPWSPWHLQGYYSAPHSAWVLNSAQFRHHNVLIHHFAENQATIPQSSLSANQSFQHSYTLTLPPSAGGVSRFTPENIYVVAYLREIENTLATEEILNAGMQKLLGAAEIVSVPEFSIKTELFYPNPAAQIIFFRKSAGRGAVRILDISGNIVSKASAEKCEQLDVSGLPPGLYFIEIFDGTRTQREKLIIAR